MLNENKLGKRIKETRKIKHMTAERLAEMADISLGFLREVERGVKKPSIDTLIVLANALDVSADTLLCDSVDISQPLVLAGIAKKLEGLPKEQITFIEKMIDSIKEI